MHTSLLPVVKVSIFVLSFSFFFTLQKKKKIISCLPASVSETMILGAEHPFFFFLLILTETHTHHWSNQTPIYSESIKYSSAIRLSKSFLLVLSNV